MPTNLSTSATSIPPSNDPSAALPVEHPTYYMSEGDVVIRVQNTLFKLDLTVLHSKSPVLRMIMPPIYAGKARMLGFNHEHPFELREVSEVDFVRLLWVLYPSAIQTCQPTTTEDWVSILKLSSIYQMEDVRNKAMAHLHSLPLDPIRKIAIWQEYHLDQGLLTSSYVALCLRTEPLTLPMAMTLGLKAFTRLAAARDIFHQRTSCCKRHVHKDRQLIAEDVVREIFPRQKMRCPH